MRNAALLFALLFSIQIAARADFSYTSNRKTTGGSMAAMAGAAGNGMSKVYFKGQKMRTDNGDTVTQIDFDAQTITSIDNARKTIAVRNFSDIAGAGQAGAGVTIDAKETGQHKAINGFDAKELILTMDMDMPQGRAMGAKMQLEVDMWIASGVPGAGEMREFYRRNAAKFPWSALGGNAGLQQAMAEMQKKIASMDGVTVEQVIRMKPAGGAAGAQMPAMPQMTPAQSAQMAQAQARLEAMKAQGGAQAAMAEQMLKSMGALTGGAAPGSASGAGSLLEITVDSTDFSTAAVPDSVFAIPAGYQKLDAK